MILHSALEINATNENEYYRYQLMGKFLSQESGATAIEYGLIAVLLAIGCIAVLETFAGATLGGIFSRIADVMTQPTEVPKVPAAPTTSK